jgi:hypothetical protein
MRDGLEFVTRLFLLWHALFCHAVFKGVNISITASIWIFSGIVFNYAAHVACLLGETEEGIFNIT